MNTDLSLSALAAGYPGSGYAGAGSASPVYQDLLETSERVHAARVSRAFATLSAGGAPHLPRQSSLACVDAAEASALAIGRHFSRKERPQSAPARLLAQLVEGTAGRRTAKWRSQLRMARPGTSEAEAEGNAASLFDSALATERSKAIARGDPRGSSRAGLVASLSSQEHVHSAAFALGVECIGQELLRRFDEFLLECQRRCLSAYAVGDLCDTLTS